MCEHTLLGFLYPFVRFVTIAGEQAASGFPLREMRGHGQHARPSHSHFGSLTKEHGVHTETASHVTGQDRDQTGLDMPGQDRTGHDRT